MGTLFLTTHTNSYRKKDWLTAPVTQMKVNEGVGEVKYPGLLTRERALPPVLLKFGITILILT